MGYLYQRCEYSECGWCYNPAKRKGLPYLNCEGTDTCLEYKIEQKLPQSEDNGQKLPNSGRIDIIGQNGNDGEHYMGDAMTCDSCGAILQDRLSTGNGLEFYCPNEECTGILANREIPDFMHVEATREALIEAGYRPPVDDEDVVNEPSHYKIGDVDVIDIIRATLNEEAFDGYLMGNILKYRLRAGKKDNVEQDIAKAMRYEAWLK